jgi:membrane protein YqaA with SNARE-associated domain
MEYLTEFGYFGLFFASFLAATILPLSSEAVLVFLLLNDFNPVVLLAVATFGNVLGSALNYALGYGGSIVFMRKYSASVKNDIQTALARFKKYGTVSLLFAWLPVIGDPLTVAAGILKINIPLFLFLVTLGKLARYVVICFMVLSLVITLNFKVLFA